MIFKNQYTKYLLTINLSSTGNSAITFDVISNHFPLFSLASLETKFHTEIFLIHTFEQGTEILNPSFGIAINPEFLHTKQ